MAEKKQHLYEGMFIISAKLSDDARQKAMDRVSKAITDRDGEILKIHDRGRSRLAYEIKKQREGHYYIVYFNAPPSSINELWREYELHEDLIRFMTLRTAAVMEKIEFKPIDVQH